MVSRLGRRNCCDRLEKTRGDARESASSLPGWLVRCRCRAGRWASWGSSGLTGRASLMTFSFRVPLASAPKLRAVDRAV